MAEINGAWVPADEQEMAFINRVTSACQQAHQQGVDQDAITSGLMFLAASLTVEDVESKPDPYDVAEPPDKVQHCPGCAGDIDDVTAYIGGDCVVEPCGCTVDIDSVEGWVDRPGGDSE